MFCKLSFQIVIAYFILYTFDYILYVLECGYFEILGNGFLKYAYAMRPIKIWWIYSKIMSADIK